MSAYDSIIAGFCTSCRNKKISDTATVEDFIRRALEAGETNNMAAGYMIVETTLNALEREGGCQQCINVLKRVCDMMDV